MPSGHVDCALWTNVHSNFQQAADIRIRKALVDASLEGLKLVAEAAQSYSRQHRSGEEVATHMFGVHDGEYGVFSMKIPNGFPRAVLSLSGRRGSPDAAAFLCCAKAANTGSPDRDEKQAPVSQQ